MPRRVIVLLIVVLVFLGLVLMVALRRQAPVIPDDPVHLESRGRPDDCMRCHAHDGVAPRGPNHPFGNDCRRCHFEVGERG
jgi:hypothetical protein